ncbi:plasmid stabilization protein [Photorhabdus temperata subsp. temperata M1021]|nr:plasmid stabilization protein [Photorhabdus temperata subsp. temperata M1021]
MSLFIPEWGAECRLKDMSALFPGLRMGRYEHHYVFCLPREGAPALIVAIFHERMDLMTRLLGLPPSGLKVSSPKNNVFHNDPLPNA